jgi:hypothetical protein
MISFAPACSKRRRMPAQRDANGQPLWHVGISYGRNRKSIRFEANVDPVIMDAGPV